MHARSAWRSTSGPACPRSRSSASRTRPCARRATACTPRCSNSGFEFPARRITANLAPADVPKIGPGFDLALACGVLAASGQIPSELLDAYALFGELSLDGEVRASHGTLAVAEATRKAGLDMLVLGPARAREAMLVDDLRIGVVERLSSAARVLSGGAPDPMPKSGQAPVIGARRAGLDLADVRGRREAVKALTVAAAGAHNSLLSGPPGHRQDDARPAPAIDPAAAGALGGDRSDAHPQRHRQARRVSSCSLSVRSVHPTTRSRRPG